MPRVIAELTAALEPHADAIDRAQIAALGGYPADLCGVWERSKLCLSAEGRQSSDQE